MSTTIETHNRGNVGSFGFCGIDTANIRMGELPDMSLPRFCFYATEVVLKALPYCTSDQKRNIRAVGEQCADFLRSQNDGAEPILDDVVPESRSDSYSANPFWVDKESRTISIGETYEGIQIDHFAYFALRTFGGGMFGWGEGRTISSSAIQGVRIIRDAINHL